MGTDDVKKGYEAPVMPPHARPLNEGYLAPNMPFAPLAEIPTPPPPRPAKEKE